ncbi:MAG: HPF/RaiA family ribosome-associated protein [Microthrixaceae bacterium]
MSTTPGPDDATVAQCLHLGHGFHEDEREKAVEVLDRLDHRLVGEPASGVRLDLHAKDRDQPGQKVTLELHVAGLPTMVGTSEKEELWSAVIQVKDEVLRQLNEAKDKRVDRREHRH